MQHFARICAHACRQTLVCGFCEGPGVFQRAAGQDHLVVAGICVARFRTVLQLGDLVAVFRRHRFGLFLGASVDFVGVSKIAPDRLLTQRIVFLFQLVAPQLGGC